MSTSGGSSGGPVSIGGTGVTVLGGYLETLKSDGTARIILDDSAGNMSGIYLLTAYGVKSDGFLVLSAEVVTEDTDLTGNECVVLVDASAGAVTITLDAGTWAGTVWYIKKIDSSANAVTVAAPDGYTVDGADGVQLTSQWEGVMVQAANDEFYVIGQVATSIL